MALHRHERARGAVESGRWASAVASSMSDAVLIADPKAVENPFYLLAPSWAIYPLIGIATLATVVASQALISGAFSLTQQAVQLGFMPRVEIVHTSATTEGQIFVPSVNAALAVACIAVVMVAGSSSRLAAAYGIAVTGTMAVTSVLFYAVARNHWGWSRLRAGSLVALFLAVDLAFFGANIIKFADGGWFPIVVAAAVYTLMTTWKRGRAEMARRFAAQDFLYRRRHQGQIRGYLAALLGVITEYLARPADQSRRGFIAGAREHVDENQDFLAGESARFTQIVLKLDVQQFGHQVVGRVLYPPVEILLKSLSLETCLRDFHGLAGFCAQRCIDSLANRIPRLIGNAKQHTDNTPR